MWCQGQRFVRSVLAVRPHLHKRTGAIMRSYRRFSTSRAHLATVQDTLAHWIRELEGADVPEAALSAEHILSHILAVSRVDLPNHLAKTLSPDVTTEVDRLMTCRIARMPVQYIIGEWDFYNITLKLKPPVFIPRPETECLVEKALQHLLDVQSPKVLEIGCGSGAISLALLKCIKDLRCVAVDQSKHAAQLTRENSELLGVSDRLDVIEGKVTNEKFPDIPYEEFDLILTNPPYVLRKDLMEVKPEIMLFEDMRALDGGKEGLDVIKPILTHCQHYLPPGCSLLMEVDPCHRYLIPVWMEKQSNLKLKFQNVFEDFNGKDRIVQFIKTL